MLYVLRRARCEYSVGGSGPRGTAPPEPALRPSLAAVLSQAAGSAPGGASATPPESPPAVVSATPVAMAAATIPGPRGLRPGCRGQRHGLGGPRPEQRELPAGGGQQWREWCAASGRPGGGRPAEAAPAQPSLLPGPWLAVPPPLVGQYRDNPDAEPIPARFQQPLSPPWTGLMAELVGSFGFGRLLAAWRRNARPQAAMEPSHRLCPLSSARAGDGASRRAHGGTEVRHVRRQRLCRSDPSSQGG